MKVILAEQARGSPAPGLPNHHLPQALFLLSDFSRVLSLLLLSEQQQPHSVRSPVEVRMYVLC